MSVIRMITSVDEIDTQIIPRVADDREKPAPQLSLFNPIALRDASLVWLAQHVVLLLMIYAGRTLLLTQKGMPTGATISWQTMFNQWLGWDGAAYAVIARQGYAHPWEAAFSPILPLLERAVNYATGMDPQVAGGLISNVAALGAFGLFRVLVEREFGRAAAQRATLYLVMFPLAFFFATAYTESLFLLFSVGAFLALRRGRWLAAGVLIVLATLTRQTGILLLLPLLAEVILRMRVGRGPKRLGEWASALVGVAAPVAALGGLYLYLYQQFGTFNAVSQAEETVWGKGWGIPFIGFARAGGALIHGGFDPGAQQAHILIDGAFTLALVVLSLAVARMLPKPYGVYTLAYTLVIVSTPLHNWYALMSNPRLVLGAFPIFMALGLWGKRPWIDRIILLVSLPLLALFTVVFAMGQWVA